MLSKSVINDVLEAALSTGGDFAEIFLESNNKRNVSLLNGVVEKALSGIDYGLGLRIFDGHSAIYAFTNNTDKEALIKMAKESALAVKTKRQAPVTILPFINEETDNRHIIKLDPKEASLKVITDQLKVASQSSFSSNQLITETSNSYMDYVQDVLIANSHGLYVTDRRTRLRATISAIASSQNEKQTAHYNPGAHMGFEFFQGLDMKAIGEECADTAAKMLLAEHAPGGCMDVIIDNGFGGVIFHEACGHSLEATAVAIGASVFCGKLNSQIAASCVTAIDDGTMANEWGSQNYDDEGNKTRRNLLIENGILKGYLIDRLNGLKMGMEATGSSRRESYRYAPTSRMTNTFIAPGNDKIEDIFAKTEYGLYAKKMGGGSVSPGTGEFNFSVTEGYLVKDGKIVKPVRGATLIGKGYEVLMNIDMVSDNFRMEQGMCGSISGSVPTNVGQPMLRVKQMTVGGRK